MAPLDHLLTHVAWNWLKKRVREDPSALGIHHPNIRRLAWTILAYLLAFVLGEVGLYLNYRESFVTGTSIEQWGFLAVSRFLPFWVVLVYCWKSRFGFPAFSGIFVLSLADTLLRFVSKWHHGLPKEPLIAEDPISLINAMGIFMTMLLFTAILIFGSTWGYITNHRHGSSEFRQTKKTSKPGLIRKRS